MHVTTINMDPRIARIHYRDYMVRVREAKARRASEEGRQLTPAEVEDRELFVAYRALAKGQRVLNLNVVMREAGVFEWSHLPRLAICRANALQCYFGVRDDQQRRFIFAADDAGLAEPWHYGRLPRYSTVTFPDGTFPTQTSDRRWRDQERRVRPEVLAYPVKAMVPSVPPNLRPTKLFDYHVLWEAVWERAVPEDPMLLKRVGDAIYVVVAQWDLSPLERQVLEGRLR